MLPDVPREGPLPEGPKVDDLDLAAIADAVNRVRPLAPNDILFIGGSVVEGLATPWSDLDVYMVAETGEPAVADWRQIDVPFDQIVLDVEVWLLDEVKKLVSRLSSIGPRWRSDARNMMKLSAVEREFLHRLRLGVPIHNAKGLDDLRHRANWRDLAGLVYSRALLRVTNAQTDLLGFVAQRDWPSAILSAQTVVHFSVSALLGVFGETHPGEKWIFRLLRRLRSDELPEGLLAGWPDLESRVFDLLASSADRDDAEAYVRGCVEFANQVIPYAQLVLDGKDGNPEGPPHVIVPSVAASDANRLEGLPPLALGAQIRFVDGRWYLFHVNAPRMFELNEVAVRLLAGFAGRWPAGEAVLHARSCPEADEAVLKRALREMEGFLNQAGLLDRLGNKAKPRNSDD